MAAKKESTGSNMIDTFKEFKETKNIELDEKFVRLPWEECMKKYGTDKPDLRFGNEIHKTLIEGEMHGIRALMHFDLMRLFTPAPTTAENKNTVLMPYVDTYPCPYPTHIKTSELFKKAVKDMEIAREKLGSLDTLEFMKWNRTLNDRFFSMSSASSACPNLFFYARGTRMNFMAATALLARMHMWNGDYAKARKYAEELVNGYNDQYIYYKFEPSANLTKPANFRPTRPEELIFAVTRNLEDSIEMKTCRVIMR